MLLMGIFQVLLGIVTASVYSSLKLDKMTSSLTYEQIIMYIVLSDVSLRFWAVYITIFDAAFLIGQILSIIRYGTIMGINYENYSGKSSIFCEILIVYILTCARGVDIPTSLLEKPMMLSLVSYSSHHEAADSWDQIQFSSQCCGVHNYSDWFGMSLHGNGYDWYQSGSPNDVPDSCCKELSVGCGRNILDPKNIYSAGCVKNLKNYIENQFQRHVPNLFMYVVLIVLIVVCFCELYKCGRFNEPILSKGFLVLSRVLRRVWERVWTRVQSMLLARLFKVNDANNRNNDIANTPLVENNVRDGIETDIGDEGADADVLINIRDDEENEYNGN